MPQDTSDTTRINLICEDRLTGKKCQFNDLAIQLLPDEQIPLAELISSNISLHYFLSNSMIFQHNPDIDIVLGFYPSNELKSLALPMSRSAGVSTLSFKFEKLPTFSSESEQTPVLNQNQILSNKIINNPNQSKGKQPIFKLLSLKTSEDPMRVSLQGSINATSISSQDSSEDHKKEKQSVKKEQEENNANNSLIQEDKIEQNENNNNQNDIEPGKQIYKQEDEGMHDESKESDSLEAREPHIEIEEPDLCGTPSDEEEKGSSCSLNRKRKASEALESSKNGSPCISFTENDQQCTKLPPPLLKKSHLSTATTNTESSVLQSSNPQINNNNFINNSMNNYNNLSNKQLSSFKVNSSFNAYNPILSSSGIKIGDIGQFQQIQHATTSGNSSNILLNSCSGSSRQSRNKERTIKEAIEMVTKWRDLQEDYRQKHQVKGLQEVADELNISKKVLDYYFQELRTAEFFGFDFDSNLSNKMGILRKFIDEQKKNHENKNKNFKITRNLQFKYRLKEDGNNLMNMGSTASTVSSSSGIENQNINTQQSKVNQMNNFNFPCNEDINSNIFQNAMAINRLVKGNNNSVDYSNIQDDISLDKSINGLDKINNNKNQASSSCSSFQEVLSKNSPLFLSFFNTHNNSNITQSSFIPSIVKTPKMSIQSQQSTQPQISKQQQQPSQLKQQQQKPFLSSQTQSLSTMISSNFKPNPTNNNPLNIQQKSSQPSQQLQQTTQQLAGLDKALCLLELINQTTQQSQPVLQNNISSSPAIPGCNMFEDVLNFMKLFTPGVSEPESQNGQTQQAVTATPSSNSQDITQSQRNANSPSNISSNEASFMQTNPPKLADGISNE